MNSACKYYGGQNDLTWHVTQREAVSGTVINDIFEVWHYEVLWTCALTSLLWYAFDYVRSVLYFIPHSTTLSNALHCTLASKLWSHSQAHSWAHSQVHSQVHLMMLPACLTIHFQVSSPNAVKYTPKYTLKYTSNCTQYHTPILLDYMLPSNLWWCSQVHSCAHSPLHSPDARHSQSQLTICSHVFSWVLDPETGWVAGTRHQEADGRWRQAWEGR